MADENAGRFDDLKTRANDLHNDEDSWTWWDADPEVAWGVPESYYGRLAAIYELAGWEKCYHRDSALFHFNIKLNGTDAYRALHDAVDASGLDYDGVMEHVYSIEESDREDWWDETSGEFVFASRPRREVWSCGRSGGYLNAPKSETDYDTMIELARHCSASREWFNGAGYGADVAGRAIEGYREAVMEELASPRIERIEA